MKQEVCYLCGNQILAGEERTEDHVVPSTLIEREQPKAKGFDYVGKLPSHQPCNNHFGDEGYVAKALTLLRVLHSPQMNSPLQHAVHPDISILPLDASLLAEFTPRDLRFFKILDVTQIDSAELSNPAFYVGKQKANPIREALPVVLSVLAKSAAALLVKRYLSDVPIVWRIYAQAYNGNLTDYDLADKAGESLPFDVGVRAWVIPLRNNNYHVVYAVKDTLVHLTFAFNDHRRLLRELVAAHADAETWIFVGTNLNQLKTAGWKLHV